MSIQILLCVESKDTDYIYIKKTIEHYYHIDETIKLKDISMNGKGNFFSQKTLNEITRATKKFKEGAKGKTYVFFCVDTDNIHSSKEDTIFFNRIIDFTKGKGYACIWFCKCIEEVYIGKKISNSEKTACASKFASRNLILNVKENDLSCEKTKTQVNKSNILCILDNYLHRKNKNASQ